jgi:hypothetical protein
VMPAAEPGSWQIGVNGYFRAPMAIGISSRQGPDDMKVDDMPGMPGSGRPGGPARTQYSYGPNRTVDANYYSFAYTRLQEQDWAEIFIHARKTHVDAAVGWMGYWFQSVGFRNPDAGWSPGLAYLALDTDFGVAGFKPNIALTMGAWWPSFGYFEKYDTYTLGRFRQIGAQGKLTVPLDPDFLLTVVEGFGTGRDGSFNYGAPPFYGAKTGLDLITYGNARLAFKKIADVAVHYSTQSTTDPYLTPQDVPGDKSFGVARVAHLTVVGGELNVRLPYAGHLWISPSYIHVRNGWALGSTGIEVMHSLGGIGLAGNYLGYNGTPDASTGSGSLFNLGFLYENTLSSVLGQASGRVPELTLSIFGLLTNASLDLPADSMTPPNLIPQPSIKQFKYGADLTLQATTWFAFMLRGDAVNYDRDHPGFVFASITPRAIISSHFLSGERIYVQYSRYIYGDKMVLNGQWPWGTPLVAGSNVLQQGPYNGKEPDQNVVKLQADIAF